MKIKFDLHAALDGKPVINGKGEDFQFEAYYPGTNYPVVGHFGNVQSRYTKNGHSEMGDLFMKPEKLTRWMLVNEACGYATKDLAIYHMKRMHTQGQIANLAIIKIEFYEGEGLE